LCLRSFHKIQLNFLRHPNQQKIHQNIHRNNPTISPLIKAHRLLLPIRFPKPQRDHRKDDTQQQENIGDNMQLVHQGESGGLRQDGIDDVLVAQPRTNHPPIKHTCRAAGRRGEGGKKTTRGEKPREASNGFSIETSHHAFQHLFRPQMHQNSWHHPNIWPDQNL